MGDVECLRDALDVPSRGRAGRLQARARPCFSPRRPFRGTARSTSSRLRKGVKYSNGAAVRPPTSSGRSARLPRPGSGRGLLHRHRRGRGLFEEPDGGGDISGIVTNNAKRTITIRLAKARGDFLTISRSLFAAPVPGNTDPAIQNGTIPGTGPYKFTNYDPNRSFTMARNPFFSRRRTFPKGNPNTIERPARRGCRRGDSARDQRPGPTTRTRRSRPTGSRTPRARAKLLLRKTANTYYFWMNIKEAPFNKLKVRQAVNYAIDREGAADARLGRSRSTDAERASADVSVVPRS